MVSSQSVVTGLSVSVAVGVDAYGADSFADVGLTLSVVDRGLVSYATGSVTLAAAASASEGEAAYVAGYLSVDISSAPSIASDLSAYGENVTLATQLSFQSVALAFPLEATIGDATLTQATSSDGDLALSGNLASFSAFLEASGENGSTFLQSDAQAYEGQLSSVLLVGQAGVSHVTVYTKYTGTRGGDAVTTTDSQSLVYGGAGKDSIWGGAGADWLFGEDGKDSLRAGGGDDGLYGGSGEDGLWGEEGNDWLFGGRGDDSLYGGAGADLLYGGAGDDVIGGGSGQDLIDGGIGRDSISGEDEDDIFRLGARGGDGDDRYRGGAGADLWLITDRFDDDVIMDFRIAEGDRIIGPGGGWDDPAALAMMNGASLSLCRSRQDGNDLEIAFRFGPREATLTLDSFFSMNAAYASHIPRHGAASDLQALQLLSDLFGDDFGVYAAGAMDLFGVGDMISDFG